MTVKANKLKINNVLHDIDAKALNGQEADYYATAADLAAEYDSTATYALETYCMHEGQLYQCSTAIATAEAWTAGHWTAVTVTGEIAEEVTRAKGVEGSLSNLDTTAQNNLVAAINEVHKKARTVIFTTPSFSSLPQTFSDSQVTFDGSITHLTPDLAVTPNDYKLSNTGAMAGSWELDFSVEGYVTVRGTFSGSTGTTLKVWASHS